MTELLPMREQIASEPSDLVRAPPEHETPEFLLRYAQDLARHCAEKYRTSALGLSPDWAPFDDLGGVLTQLDNMLSGMSVTATPGNLRAAPASPEGWVMVPREPTEAMILAMRMAELAPGKRGGYPIWDNMDCPSNGDRDAWEDVLPYLGEVSFHASYECVEWQIKLFQTAYRAMIAAAPGVVGGGDRSGSSGADIARTGPAARPETSSLPAGKED